jgi:hypothetical protein
MLKEKNNKRRKTMKTKTLMVGAVLSTVVFNSVFAVSVDDRKTFCEKHPDKYVWVEKNEACVPINPCASSNESIKTAYCIESPAVGHVKLIEKYIQYNLNTNIASSKSFDGVFAVNLMDGGYMVFSPSKAFDGFGTTEEFISSAFWVYGKDNTIERLDERVIYSNKIETRDVCAEIADLSTLGNGALCTYDYGNTTCVIKCEKFSREDSVLFSK